MCIRRETREKARRSLAFSPVSKPHTHITYMLRQCTSIVYVSSIIRKTRIANVLCQNCHKTCMSTISEFILENQPSRTKYSAKTVF